MTRPGDRVRSVASRLFRSETMERVIDPVLADLQCEYGEARAHGLLWRARLSLVRSYFGFARALLWLGARTACRPLVEGPRSEAARTCLVSVFASAIVTIALVIPPLVNGHWWQGDVAFGARLSVTLVPQALPLSLPAGLCVAVLWARRGTRVTWRGLGTWLAIAIAFTLVVWVSLEWMTPQANRAFREMVAARLGVSGRTLALEPGMNEVGLSRLAQRSDPAAVHHYQLLWALCFAPASLSLLAFGLAGYVRRAASALALAMGLSLSYMASMWIIDALTAGSRLPSFVDAWVPNLMFVLVACGLLVRSLRTRVA
jgi:lipopolysaccharide export LptBFGC system permease protein LptF